MYSRDKNEYAAHYRQEQQVHLHYLCTDRAPIYLQL
jgi:hypothetical protein